MELCHSCPFFNISDDVFYIILNNLIECKDYGLRVSPQIPDVEGCVGYHYLMMFYRTCRKFKSLVHAGFYSNIYSCTFNMFWSKKILNDIYSPEKSNFMEKFKFICEFSRPHLMLEFSDKTVQITIKSLLFYICHLSIVDKNRRYAQESVDEWMNMLTNIDHPFIKYCIKYYKKRFVASIRSGAIKI